MRKVVKTDRAPEAIGPYSQAIVVSADRLVFTAGQLGMDPATGRMASGGIAEQTRQALENVRAILEAAGSDLENVVKVTVYLKNMDDFAAMNEVYAGFFAEHPPARAAVEVARLPKDALIEIEVVARVRE